MGRLGEGMSRWRGDSDMGVEAISFGRWDIHVSDLGDKYYWCVSSAYGNLHTGLSDTREQAKIDALDNLIKLIDEWRSEAVQARDELGGAAAKR